MVSSCYCGPASTPPLGIALQLYFGYLHDETAHQGDLPLLAKRWPCDKSEAYQRFSPWNLSLKGWDTKTENTWSCSCG